MIKQTINLSPKAIETINEILGRGNDVEISCHGGHLKIYEVPYKPKKYDTFIAQKR